MKTNIKKNGLHFSPLTLSSYENNYIASKNRSLSSMHTLIFLFVKYLLCCVSGSLLNIVVAWVKILTWMQGSNWQFADRRCLFADRFKQFFAKLTNQYFPSVRICVFRETTKFLFTHQARQFGYILLQINYFLVFG